MAGCKSNGTGGFDLSQLGSRPQNRSERNSSGILVKSASDATMQLEFASILLGVLRASFAKSV
jgi:hypothetical protein